MEKINSLKVPTIKSVRNKRTTRLLELRKAYGVKPPTDRSLNLIIHRDLVIALTDNYLTDEELYGYK